MARPFGVIAAKSRSDFRRGVPTNFIGVPTNFIGAPTIFIGVLTIVVGAPTSFLRLLRLFAANS
jgi:hypothetical protein